jgi:HlyD family secretion protein
MAYKFKWSVIKTLLQLFIIATTGFLLLSCSDYLHEPLQGYIEGEYTYLSSSIPGRLKKRAINRGDSVTQGQLIFMLEPQPESDQLQQAQAQLESAKAKLKDAIHGQRSTIIASIIAQRDQAEAALDLARKNFQRMQQLYQKNVIDKATYDNAQSNLTSSQGRVNELEANLKEAELGQRQFQIVSQSESVKAAAAILEETRWRLSQKEVYAPENGLIFDTFYNEGEEIAAAHPVASLLAPRNIKLIFYIPEPLRAKVAIGDEVAFDCDSCARYSARINFISPQAEFTPPVIFSRESRAKLVYRVQAALSPEVAEKVNPGQPVDVYIEEKKTMARSLSQFWQRISTFLFTTFNKI